MAGHYSRLLRWTFGGGFVAVALSVVTLLLPEGYGGYYPWDNAHLTFHNLVAVVVRIVVFAAAGAAIASSWHRKRR
jgi:hypothetical protein